MPTAKAAKPPKVTKNAVLLRVADMYCKAEKVTAFQTKVVAEWGLERGLLPVETGRWHWVDGVLQIRACDACGADNPEQITLCPRCGTAKCRVCDMGDDVECPACETAGDDPE